MQYNGKSIKLDIYGESHSDSIGVKIFGIKKGEKISLKTLQEFTDRRKSTSKTETARREEDKLILVKGIKNGTVSENEIEFKVKNKDVKKEDYEKIKNILRPSTADFPAFNKYGFDYKTGSGKFSGRMTLPMCIAGGIAVQILNKYGIEIKSHVLSVGKLKCKPANALTGEIPEDKRFINKAKKLIEKTAKKKDSLGGVIECVITGLPVGLGDALYNGLESEISSVIFGIPSVKGIEFGSGFKGSTLKGSANNDGFYLGKGKIQTYSNNAGGILGGMSTGMPLIFNVAFKPIPSIAKTQNTVDIKKIENVKLNLNSRSDACILFRALPIVESGASIPLLSVLQFEREESSIEVLRNKINYIDDTVLSSLEKRLKYVKKISEIKKKNKMKIEDLKREKEIINSLTKTYPELKTLIEKIYPEIFKFFKGIQK